MVDFNKEIKLGDLFRRRAKEPGEETGAAPPEEKPKKERRSLFSRAPREKKAKEPKAPTEPKPRKERRRRTRAAAVEAKPAPALPQIPLMRAFNLMPKEEPREKGSRLGLAQVAVAVFGLLVVAGLAGGYLFLGAGVTTKQGELDDLRAQLAELEVPAEAPSGGGAVAADGQARTAALSTALAGRIAWDRVLRKVSLVIPDGVWLTTLSATTPNATAGAPATAAAPAAPGQASPNSLTAAGFATSQENVALLLSRLESIPELTAVQLQSSTRSEGDSGRTYAFSILASVDPLGAPAS
ncbi:MAG TPA: PilN domain-containing protein [Gaiellaceae bacterium]|nr:PilN domain-containing protein [Gaiellaceae bacterium]